MAEVGKTWNKLNYLSTTDLNGRSLTMPMLHRELGGIKDTHVWSPKLSNVI